MMSEKLREQISALADNELPTDEHELLIHRFSLDKHQRLCWERYHLIGEAMRKALPQIDTHGFADRIMGVLNGDVLLVKKPEARIIDYFRNSAVGMALAACVAIVAVYGLHHGDETGMKSATSPSEIVPSTAALQTNLARYDTSNNTAWNGNVPDVRAQLANYVINHNETATAIEQQGMLPYFYLSSVQYGKPSQTLSVPQKPSQQDKR
jgi:sigma-E factor negative regulatory protein RseA